MKPTGIVAIVIIILLLGAGIIWAVNQDSSSTDLNVPANNDAVIRDTEQEPSQANPTEETVADSSTVITYTDAGFDPEVLNVKVGTEVTIKNASSRQLDFASDDHPSHRDNSELNLGVIEPGQSQTVVLSTAGTWGYHNHIFANHVGRIIAE